METSVVSAVESRTALSLVSKHRAFGSRNDARSAQWSSPCVSDGTRGE